MGMPEPGVPSPLVVRLTNSRVVPPYGGPFRRSAVSASVRAFLCVCRGTGAEVLGALPRLIQPAALLLTDHLFRAVKSPLRSIP
jgi:hypothetical protein